MVLLFCIAACIVKPAGAQDGREDFNWSGIWETSYGRMELSQVGNRIVGFYEPNFGRVYGIARGRVCDLDWSVVIDGVSSGGTAQFKLLADDISFEGDWSFSGAREKYGWSGLRTADRLVSGELAQPDYCLWRGRWDIVDGVIYFEQDPGSDEVTGYIYMSEEMTYNLSGKSDGWYLNLNYSGNGESGTGTLIMLSDLSGFTGSIENSGSGEVSELEGTFSSVRNREDFSGTWITGWGLLELRPGSNEDHYEGTVREATISGSSGTIYLDAFTAGDMMWFTWEMDGRTSGMEGDGRVRMQIDRRNFRGVYTDGTGEYEFVGKLR